MPDRILPSTYVVRVKVSLHTQTKMGFGRDERRDLFFTVPADCTVIEQFGEDKQYRYLNDKGHAEHGNYLIGNVPGKYSWDAAEVIAFENENLHLLGSLLGIG